jgi:transcription initiation factor TFIIA large subunit
MSNSNIGQIYALIIHDVIDTSRLDFEEGGVDESVLEELRIVSIMSLITMRTIEES